MNVKIVFRLMLIVMVLAVTNTGSSYAEEILPKCTGCHKTLKDVLKPQHPKINSSTTCFVCHDAKSKAGGLGQKIHAKHIDALGASEQTCLSCHGPDAKNRISISHKGEGITFDRAEVAGLAKTYGTWSNSKLLANSHKTKGIYCSACHEGYDSDDVDGMTQKCTACHGGYDAMVKKTVNYKPRNPHKSHYPALGCVKCHQVHGEFTDYCNSCHSTNFKWLQKK